MISGCNVDQRAETIGGCAPQFCSLEPEVVCKLLFVRDLEVVSGAEYEYAPPPPGQTELPTCPVCLERLDEHISGVITTVPLVPNPPPTIAPPPPPPPCTTATRRPTLLKLVGLCGKAARLFANLQR